MAGVTPIGTFNGVGNIGNVTDPAQQLENAISQVIGFVTICAGLWFIVQVFSGAISWLSSGGDKQQVEIARKKLTHAVIGFVIVVLSYLLIALVSYFLGIDFLHLAILIGNL